MQSHRRFGMQALPLIVLIGVTCAPSVLPGPDRADLLQLNRSLLESMLVDQDAGIFARTAVPGVVVIPPGGIVEGREQVIAGLSNFRVSAIELGDVRVVTEGNATVVVGRIVPRGELRSGEALGPMRFLNAYVWTNEGWRLLARSLTPCSERAIAAGRC